MKSKMTVLMGRGGCVVAVLLCWPQLLQAKKSAPKVSRSAHGTKRKSVPKVAPKRSAKVAQPQHLILGVPSSRPVAGDPLQPVPSQDANVPKGRLIYSFYQVQDNYEQQVIPTSLVFRTTKSLGQQASGMPVTLSYSAEKTTDPKRPLDRYGVLFAPQWSPDGRYVLLRFGDPWNSTGAHCLYVLDTQTQKLKLIAPPTLCYDEAIWSPDGNYIAYIQGGDIGGNPFYLIGSDCIPLPLGLTVCNWRTGEEHWVVDNDTLKNSFAWSAPHTLFYGVMPQGHQELLRNYWDSKLQTDWQKQQNPIAPFDLKAVSAARPDIYVYSIESKQSKLLIRDGYRPLPSPDGKKIAFFGSEAAIRNYPLNQGWQRAPGYSSLMIANRDGTGRVALDRPKTAYPLLLWEADNAHLLALKEPNNQAQLDEWDVTSQQFRNILMLQAQDYEVLKRRHHFTMLSTSHDGNTLFVFQKEVTGVTGSLYDTRGALQSVDLRNGTFKTLFQTKNDSGLDWHDESAPTLAALTTP